jgi:hypothetical protein
MHGLDLEPAGAAPVGLVRCRRRLRHDAFVAGGQGAVQGPLRRVGVGGDDAIDALGIRDECVQCGKPLAGSVKSCPGLRIATSCWSICSSLHPIGIARGKLSETRRWLDRALAATPSEPTIERVTGLYATALIAGLQGDLPAATARVAEGQALVEQMTDATAHGMVSIADGFTALVSGEFDRACARFDDGLSTVDEPATQVIGMVLLGRGAGVPRRKRPGPHLAGESACGCGIHG